MANAEWMLTPEKDNPYWFVEAGQYRPQSLQIYTDRELELLRRAWQEGIEAQAKKMVEWIRKRYGADFEFGRMIIIPEFDVDWQDLCKKVLGE